MASPTIFTLLFLFHSLIATSSRAQPPSGISPSAAAPSPVPVVPPTATPFPSPSPNTPTPAPAPSPGPGTVAPTPSSETPSGAAGPSPGSTSPTTPSPTADQTPPGDGSNAGLSRRVVGFGSTAAFTAVLVVALI